jgi:hypothetical protein
VLQIQNRADCPSNDWRFITRRNNDCNPFRVDRGSFARLGLA